MSQAVHRASHIPTLSLHGLHGAKNSLAVCGPALAEKPWRSLLHHPQTLKGVGKHTPTPQARTLCETASQVPAGRSGVQAG